MTEFTTIPVLDVSALHSNDPTALRALAQDFATAYGETGFGYITNHGIDPALTDAVFAASKTFHALPMADKMTLALNENHRGYIPINTSTDVNSTLTKVTKPNQSASFMMMREDDTADPETYLSGPNIWPTFPEFRQALQDYNTAMAALAAKLLNVAITAVGANPADILPAFAPPTTWLRLLHYPPTPPLGANDLFGSAPHTDFGALTILAQDNVGGLQVKTPAGNWVDAPRIPGTFVVNVGDMLHRLSNGRLRSTPHRVINRSGFERYSCPFFYDPHVSANIAPLTGTGTPLFDPLNYGDFLRGELGAAYDRHKKP